MELNREQIAKELAMFIEDMPADLHLGFTRTVKFREFLKDALALIRELSEENDRLRAENESLAIIGFKDCEISQTRIYRVRDKHPAVMAVIADTVMKMQDRLNAERGYDDEWQYNSWWGETINQIAKELLEEGSDND